MECLVWTVKVPQRQLDSCTITLVLVAFPSLATTTVDPFHHCDMLQVPSLQGLGGILVPPRVYIDIHTLPDLGQHSAIMQCGAED